MCIRTLQCHCCRCLVAANNNAVADLVAEALVVLSAAQSDADTNLAYVQRTGTRGRPAYIIDAIQLENMLVLNFKVPQIAKLFGVSVRTIKRWMNCIGLHVSD